MKLLPVKAEVAVMDVSTSPLTLCLEGLIEAGGPVTTKSQVVPDAFTNCHVYPPG